MAFAATAATIVSGAMAERTKFISYFIYSALISAIIYPIVVHWVWGGGWLVAALDARTTTSPAPAWSTWSAAWRRWSARRSSGPASASTAPTASPGPSRATRSRSPSSACFILLIGWFGFNPGSELAADSAVPAIAVTTLLAGVAGALVATLITWFKDGKPDVAMAGNGLLAGLVGITAGCAAVNNWSATIIGAVAGVLVVFSVAFFDRIKHRRPGRRGVGPRRVRRLGRDRRRAVRLRGRPTSGSRACSSAAAPTSSSARSSAWWPSRPSWSSAMVIVFAALKHTVGLRVSPQEELEGLDVHEHGYPGYGLDVAAGMDDGALVGAGSSIAN